MRNRSRAGVLLIVALTANTVLAEPSLTTTQPTGADAIPSALKRGTATLLDFGAHRGDPGTHFDFDSTMRAAAGNARLGDVTLLGDRFRVRKHTGDHGTITDLGELGWAELQTLPKTKGAPPAPLDDVPVVTGHLYLVHIDDTEIDDWGLIRVTDYTPNDRCTIEWAHRPGSSALPPPAMDDATAIRVADLLGRQDANLDESAALTMPSVVLQLRAGAGGGNPNRIDMRGNTTAYVDRVVPQPINFNRPLKMQDPAEAYVAGGRLRPGRCFVIERIRYEGSTAGDSNGHGELIVHAGDQEIVRVRQTPQPIKGVWDGRITIRPGQEGTVYAEVANSSTASVIIQGRLLDEADARAEEANQDASPATQPVTLP